MNLTQKHQQSVMKLLIDNNLICGTYDEMNSIIKKYVKEYDIKHPDILKSS